MRKPRQNKDEYYQFPKHCLNKDCNKVISFEKKRNKYCSHSCAASVTNVGVRKHGKLPTNCLYCGKKNKSFKNKYCSQPCQHQYQYELYIERWLNGDEDGIVAVVKRGETISACIRTWLFETIGRSCEKCGWKELNTKTNTCPVQINHIDGDCRNNKPNNLQILCPNCHSLTSNFGGLNKGNGRKGRYTHR